MATEEPVVVAEVASPAIEAAATVVSSEAVEEKRMKGKKASTKRKPAIPSSHPPYFEMIKDAISSLKDKTGSSQYAIAKFVEETQKNLPERFKKVLLIQLRRLVAQGKLVKVKASYKLPAKKKPNPAAAVVKKPAPKAKAVTRPTAAAKLAAKAESKTPTKPAKVARTSTISTPGKKPAPAQKAKAGSALPKASAKAKAETPKKSAATRKMKK